MLMIFLRINLPKFVQLKQYKDGIFLEGVSLGTRASEVASIDGVWAYGRNFSVSELGRGHVIRNVHRPKWILSQCMIN